MILVVGSGVAGLACALAAVREGADVELVTPGALGPDGEEALRARAGGNTAWAQGGIAAAIDPGDTPAAHAEDTVAAGVGLVDPQAAQVLAAEGAAAVRALLADGFPADRDASGAPALGLEAAHSTARIVHAGGDRTGAALHAWLSGQARALAASGCLRLTEETTVVSLLTTAGAVSGAVLRDRAGTLVTVSATAVVLATGGYAALYSRTSNRGCARGSGITLAARVGALVADLEFVQFHPTVLAGGGQLISEAVRGAGAVLRDARGRRFMREAHPAAELAPRDVVSREIFRVLREEGGSAVWLDATGIERADGPGTLARAFPGITAATSALGLDWTRDPVPVAPAAHYTMGGVATDLDGRTSVPGLFAAGEVAATGVHGANRLASNSLLEGLVFGQRAGRAAARADAGRTDAWVFAGSGLPALIDGLRTLPAPECGSGDDDRVARAAESAEAADAVASELTALVDRGLGILRDAEGLRDVARRAARLPGPEAELAVMIAAAAEARAESRGAHQRADAPHTDPAFARRQAWVVPDPRPSSFGRTIPARSLAAC